MRISLRNTQIEKEHVTATRIMSESIKFSEFFVHSNKGIPILTVSSKLNGTYKSHIVSLVFE